MPPQSSSSNPNTTSFKFTIEDVRKQLNILGYTSVPDEKLGEFAEDLRKLIEYDQRRLAKNNDSKDSSYSTVKEQSSDCDSSVTDIESKGFVHRTHQNNGENEPVNSRGDISNSHNQRSHNDDASTTVVTTKSQQRNRSKTKKMKRVLASKNSSNLIYSSADENSLLDTADNAVCRTDGGFNSKEVDLDDEKYKLYQRGLSAVDDCRRPQQYYKPPSSARPDLYPQRPSHEENKAFAPHLPRSFIRPNQPPSTSTTPVPHSSVVVSSKSSARKNSGCDHTMERKNDPVSKFNAYNEAWKERKVPGEQNRNQLRWRIREQMAVSEEVSKKKNPRAQSSSANNKYVVPTDKKRQDLRWEVRCNLAAFKPGSRNTQYY